MINMENLDKIIKSYKQSYNNKLTTYRNAKFVFNKYSKNVLYTVKDDYGNSCALTHKSNANRLIKNMKNIAPDLTFNKNLLNRNQVKKLLKNGTIKNDNDSDAIDEVALVKMDLKNHYNQYFTLHSEDEDPYYWSSVAQYAVPVIINDDTDAHYGNSCANIVKAYSDELKDLLDDVKNVHHIYHTLLLKKSLVESHHYNKAYAHTLEKQRADIHKKMDNMKHESEKLTKLINLIG